MTRSLSPEDICTMWIYGADIFIKNSSHRPGCIFAFPASQSCHVRNVEWIILAASVCDKPELWRVALISSGVGVIAS